MSKWTKGVGHYNGQVYEVRDMTGRPILMFGGGMTVGHGSYARRVRWESDFLVLPKHLVGATALPRLEFQPSMVGYWEAADNLTFVYSPTLPDEAEEVCPTGDSICAALTTKYRVVRDAGRGVILIGMRNGEHYAFVPDAAAPTGSKERWTAELLAGPHGEEALTALLSRAERQVVETQYLQGVIGKTITCDAMACWAWVNPDGTIQEVAGCLPGDSTVNLPELLLAGLAVPLSLNKYGGNMLEVLGLTAFSHVAYNGRDGDPFGFLVPCSEGERRTIHVVVRHEYGCGVYGFTVECHWTDAPGDQKVLERRAVAFDGSEGTTYFVFPDSERVVRVA